MNLKKLLLLGLTSMLICSCHTLVEDDFPNFSKIPVLNGTLEADSCISVQLTFSANLKDSVPPSIDDATVIVESSNGVTDTLNYTQNGWYKTALKAKAGSTYTCNAIVAGFEKVSATAYLPKPSVVENIQFTELAGMSEDGDPLASCKFSVKNDTTQALYWQVRLLEYGKHTDYNTTLEQFEEKYSFWPINLVMIPGQNEVLLNEAQPLTLFSNKEMKRTVHEMVIYVQKSDLRLNRKYDYYLEMQSVDEAYYKFKKQLYLYINANFDEIGSSAQTYPLYSNVQNGLGILNAFTTMKYKIIVNE